VDKEGKCIQHRYTHVIEGHKKILDRLTRITIWRVQESLDGVLWGAGLDLPLRP
jgi:hypothetical protein